MINLLQKKKLFLLKNPHHIKFSKLWILKFNHISLSLWLMTNMVVVALISEHNQTHMVSLSLFLDHSLIEKHRFKFFSELVEMVTSVPEFVIQLSKNLMIKTMLYVKELYKSSLLNFNNKGWESARSSTSQQTAFLNNKARI